MIFKCSHGIAHFKDKNTSDFVSGQVWARAGVENYLLDRHHERMGIVDTMKAIEVMTAKHPEAIGKLIEDKANGSAVIENATEKNKRYSTSKSTRW